MESRLPRTIGDLLDEYDADRKDQVSHPASLTTHTKVLREYFGSMPLVDVERGGKMRELCHRYAEENSRLASATIRKRLSILQSAFTLAWKRERIPSKPLMWLPPAQEPKQRFFGPEQQAALLKAADSYPTEDHSRTFVYLSMFTGRPATPLMSMKWDQVRFAEGYVYFLNRQGKQEKVAIHPKLRPVLERAFDNRTCDYVLEFRGKPIASAYHSLKRLMARAGLRGMTPFDIRYANTNVLRDADEEQEEETEAYLFISYCRRDGAKIANELHDELERLGQKCWIDHVDMKAGSFPGQLTRAVKEALAVVLILTPSANDSADVLSEIARAHTAKVRVLPVFVENTKLGEELEHFLPHIHGIEWAGAAKTAEVALEKLDIAV